MVRYWKMDLIVSGLAVASVVAMPGPDRMSTPKMEQTIQTTAVQGDILLANRGQDVKKKERHPLRMLSNLGIASWYGSVLDGHTTASGEIFDKDQMTACHRTLPFGTMVRVVDVSSGKSVVVKINDRGVLNADRIIDLSSGAARDLGILRAGVAKVRLEMLNTVMPIHKGARAVDVEQGMTEVARIESSTIPVPTI